MNDRGGQPRSVAAIFSIDILDHFFPALVLKIDIDIGRLSALGADETLEEKINPGRVYGGDAKAVTHG